MQGVPIKVRVAGTGPVNVLVVGSIHGDETAGHGYPSHPGRGEGQRPTILLSDRDYGLYIVEYTGKRPRGDDD